MSLFSKQVLQVIFACMAVICTASAEEKPLRILTSIKPLALIVQEIAGPTDSVQVLLPATASPHHYSLRVSDMRKVSAADLVVWIGPGLEAFLQKPLNTKIVGRIVTVSALTQLHWPKAQGAHAHNDHKHGVQDLHVWLNPQNAIVVANHVAEKLGLLMPAHADEYKKRAKAFALKARRLDQILSDMLISAKGKKLAVYHDAYKHYMDRYALEQVSYVTTAAGQGLGVKHLYQVERQLKKAACLLVEIGENTTKANELARRAKLTVKIVDPLAKGVTITSYGELMLAITHAILAC